MLKYLEVLEPLFEELPEKCIAMDDTLIMQGLKQGEQKAFNLLFDLLFPRLRFFTQQITKNLAEAEDISINALVKFWEKGPNDFESFVQVRKWIFTSARNDAYNYLKKAKMQQTYRKVIVSISSEVEEKKEEQAFYKLEMMMKALENNIDKLPSQCGEAFRLIFIEKVPRPEVAQRLNISPGTVNVHYSEAIKRLSKIFSEKDLITLFLLTVLSNN
jgi:RNA polymerase sigma-70 factor (ECF subfamily)